MVTVNNLSFKYSFENVFENINLEVKKGEFVSIIGHNGSGKTTLLRILIGILKPKKGRVLINGKNIHSIFNNSNNIGYINQGSIYTNLPIKVEEVIKIGIKKNNNNLINNILDSLNIADLKNRLYKTLSGGQKQKVNIARCLLQNTDIILLDEPDSFLDYHSQNEIMNILRKINKEQDITIIMVTHNIAMALEFSDKLYVLEKNMIKEFVNDHKNNNFYHLRN